MSGKLNHVRVQLETVMLLRETTVITCFRGKSEYLQRPDHVSMNKDYVCMPAYIAHMDHKFRGGSSLHSLTFPV